VSGPTCACNPQVGYICNYHYDLNKAMTNLNTLAQLDSTNTLGRFKKRLEADTPTPLAESLVDAHRQLDALRAQLAEVEQWAERARAFERTAERTLKIAYDQVAQFQTDIRKQGEELAWVKLDNAKLRDELTFHQNKWDSQMVCKASAILATFYRAPLSMSSVQPLLTLAEELNPGLKK
jgi:hypothetical protein